MRGPGKKLLLLGILQVVAVALLIGLDQWSKEWILSATGGVAGTVVPFAPGVLDFVLVFNDGASWGSFSGMRGLLVAVSAAISAVIVVLLVKRKFRDPVGLWSLTAVLAGALGNFIDRAFRPDGLVVDLFCFRFVDFPVFNVADICVVVGGIIFVLYFLFRYDKTDGKRSQEEKEHAKAD